MKCWAQVFTITGVIATVFFQTASASAQVTNLSISPAFTRSIMLICKWDQNEAHRQVQLYGHGDHESADVRIIERHSDDMIHQTKLLKMESEEPPHQISISLERYSGHIEWNQSNGNVYTGYCRPATERLF